MGDPSPLPSSLWSQLPNLFPISYLLFLSLPHVSLALLLPHVYAYIILILATFHLSKYLYQYPLQFPRDVVGPGRFWVVLFSLVQVSAAKPSGHREVGVVVAGKTGLNCPPLVESVVSFSHPDFSSVWDTLPSYQISLLGGISLFQIIYLAATFLPTHNFLGIFVVLFNLI